MTTTLTPTERAAKAQATKEAKALAAENDEQFPTKGRTYAKVIKGNRSYLGKVGAIREHNEGEIGLDFGGDALVWFARHELVRVPAPPLKQA
jgi:hypothetical protein